MKNTDNGRARSRSRAPTPGPRILRRQFSDPFVRAPRITHHLAERQYYFDEPTHEPRYPPQQGPSPFQVRTASMPIRHQPSPQCRNFDDPGHEDGENSRGHRHMRSRSVRRGRRKSRDTSYDYEGKHTTSKNDISHSLLN